LGDAKRRSPAGETCPVGDDLVLKEKSKKKKSDLRLRLPPPSEEEVLKARARANTVRPYKRQGRVGTNRKNFKTLLTNQNPCFIVNYITD